jgi:hypothetical protein
VQNRHIENPPKSQLIAFSAGENKNLLAENKKLDKNGGCDRISRNDISYYETMFAPFKPNNFVQTIRRTSLILEVPGQNA